MRFCKMAGKIKTISKRIVYRQNVKLSPFKKDIEYLFTLKLKYEEGRNNLMIHS